MRRLLLYILQQLPKGAVCIPWSVRIAPAVGKDEYDVPAGRFFQLAEEPVQAELKLSVETGLVRFQENADGIEDFIAAQVVENVVQVLLVLVHAACVPNARCVN